MIGIKIFKNDLLTLFLVFLAKTYVSSASQFSQNVWLSEYGYRSETSEELEQVTFSVHKNENVFSNSFLSKNDTEVIVHGGLSFIVFTCEAEDPISWFVNQKMKLYGSLRTRTLEFQSSSNVSKETVIQFRSLLHIYLDRSDYDYETEERFPPVFSGTWKFSCNIENALAEHDHAPSITVKLDLNSNNKISTLQSNNWEERIAIAITRKELKTSVNYSGYNFNFVVRNYPNFDANENQQIILAHNLTIGMAEYDDIDYSKLVEYEANEHITEGELIQVLCFSSKKFHPYGVYVELVMENGTEIRVSEEIYGFNAEPIVYLSGNSKLLANKIFSDEYSAEQDMLYFLSEEIQVELGMKQLNCYMPVWVDKKWDKVSKEINVVSK